MYKAVAVGSGSDNHRLFGRMKTGFPERAAADTGNSFEMIGIQVFNNGWEEAENHRLW
jgi:hypothetical protein